MFIIVKRLPFVRFCCFGQALFVVVKHCFLLWSSTVFCCGQALRTMVNNGYFDYTHLHLSGAGGVTLRNTCTLAA